MTWREHVHPHGPLVEVVPGLWQLTGSLPRSPLQRNMALWRVPGGTAIHSAVCADEPTMAEIEALGVPRVLVVPNGFHRADAARFKARYPEIQVVAPRASRDRVARVVPVDACAEDALPPLGTACLAPDGLAPAELVYRVPCDGERVALVFCDALFHHPHVPGVTGWVLRHVTRSTGELGITRIGRWLMLRDKAQFRAFLERLADTPGLAAVLVAHGDAIVEGPADALRAAAGRV